MGGKNNPRRPPQTPAAKRLSSTTIFRRFVRIRIPNVEDCRAMERKSTLSPPRPGRLLSPRSLQESPVFPNQPSSSRNPSMGRKRKVVQICPASRRPDVPIKSVSAAHAGNRTDRGITGKSGADSGGKINLADAFGAKKTSILYAIDEDCQPVSGTKGPEICMGYPPDPSPSPPPSHAKHP